MLKVHFYRVHIGGRPNPIAKWAEQGGVRLAFPSSSHPMSRWADLSDSKKNAAWVGRLGDTVDFRSLGVDLQTADMASFAGATAYREAGVDLDACGSPGEASNEPSLGHRYHFENGATARLDDLDHTYPVNDVNEMLWTNVVLTAPDQLRQRVAWALSQIFTLSEEGIGKTDEAEAWAAYYDIFVRHAFGNYRDVLAEVTFSPMMGDFLTFHDNKAMGFSGTFPDENFARC